MDKKRRLWLINFFSSFLALNIFISFPNKKNNIQNRIGLKKIKFKKFVWYLNNGDK